jgi:hypothetical protein
MGLIREPKNVDFYVIDKPWTDKEKEEFSAFIKKRKEQLKKSKPRKKDLESPIKASLIKQNDSSRRVNTNS